jgi:hypothetical protein
LKKSNLLQILSVFSAAEIREFSEYVKSPFFNKNQSVNKLFDYLRRLYPKFEEEKVLKETVSTKLYPKAEYNDGFIRSLMFSLMNLAIDYLTYTEMRKNMLFEANYRLKTMNHKGLWKQFEKESREISEEYGKVKVRTEEYYFNKYFFENERLFNLHRVHFGRNEKFIYTETFNDIITNLNYFYTCKMLKYHLYVINTRGIYNIQLKTHQVDELIKNLNTEDYNDSPLIPLMYNAIMLHLDESNEEHYRTIKISLLKEFEKIEMGDAVEIIINMENYCKRMMRKGKQGYVKELLDLYKFEIKHKTYLSEGGFSERLYYSVVETALKMKEHEWTKKFIEDHRNELFENVRESAYNYARAIYETATGNFGKAIELLSKSRYKEVFNKFEIKTLLIVCFYELNMFDQIYSSIDSYRHLLASDKYISPHRKKYYSNFLKIVKKMMQLKLRYNVSTVFEIRKLLETLGIVINSDWIEEKLSEAEKINPVVKKVR